MPVCTKCSVEKDADGFSKRSATGDKLRAHCRQCRSEANGARLKARPRDELNAIKHAWYHEDLDARRAYDRAKYATDPAAKNAAVKRWQAKNPDKLRGYRATSYARNQDWWKARAKAHYAANREAVQAKLKAWQAANPDKAAARHKRYRERVQQARIANGVNIKRRGQRMDADAVRAYKKRYRELNADAVRAYNKQRWESNKETQREKKRKAREKNLEQVRLRDRETQQRWRNENRALTRALSSLYWAKKRKAVPRWELDALGRERIWRRLHPDMTLDHIVPITPPHATTLGGRPLSNARRLEFVGPLVPLVYGFHTEANWQPLTRAENSRKGNRDWPHAPWHD